MAIDDRLDRIEGEFGAELCAGRYCRRIYHTELIILPDGREVVTGEQPLPLCDTCPRAPKGRAPDSPHRSKAGLPAAHRSGGCRGCHQTRCRAVCGARRCAARGWPRGCHARRRA